MKFRPVLLLLFFTCVFYYSFAQSEGRDEAEVAGQYVNWANQAIAEDRWTEALTALERAAGFSSVSSDISYLLALARSHEGKSRTGVLEALDRAIETNRWVIYNADKARLLKAWQLVAMRNYSGVLAVLEQTRETAYFDTAAESAMLQLLALKGMAMNFDPVQAQPRFHSRVLEAMDKYPRDPRPLRIFFEYARGAMLQKAHNKPSRPAESDLALLELALKRLPFLLETDPELAWMAAPFMRDTEAARRLVASYRAGTLSQGTKKSFRPSPPSIAAALNLGLIGDSEAAEELFAGMAANEQPVLDRELVTEIGDLLRSEEGRDLFTQKLLSFSGVIIFDEDHDGYAESRAFYSSGVIREIVFDLNRDGDVDLRVSFGPDGVPLSAEHRILSEPLPAFIHWERYPAVQKIELAGEIFFFRPADFQFAPVAFAELGGSKKHAGLAYPVPAYQNVELTRRSLVSFCSSIQRPSIEFKGGVEQIFLERGIPRQAVETLNGKQVSITEFERGAPVIQHLDLDLDGRMETIRRFRRPGPDFQNTFDYRKLIASSESDWTGEGIYKTGEMYLQDGSVVYSWDMDGSGVMNHSETKTGIDK